MPARTRATSLFPALLRHWRGARGLSQLDLALAADVSSRHLSFLETGRSRPSRELALRLGATLGLSLRDLDELLRAAGFDAEFTHEAPPRLPPLVDAVIDRMMAAHAPYPMLVVDRGYDLLRANPGAAALLGRFVLDPNALPGTPNLYALLFDPRLVRPFVVDWERVARLLVARLHREALAARGDGALNALLDGVLAQPGVPASWRHPDFSTPSEPVLALRLCRGGDALAFATTITAFSAPGNAAVEELRIESYYPLDEATATFFTHAEYPADAAR